MTLTHNQCVSLNGSPDISQVNHPKSQFKETEAGALVVEGCVNKFKVNGVGGLLD